MSSEVAIRAPRPDEAEAAAVFLNEHSRRLHGTDAQSPAELRNYWELPDVDPERDVFLAEGPDGELNGYADVGSFGGAAWLDVRGFEPTVLRPLLEAAEARAREKRPGVPIRGSVSEQDRVLRDLFESAGYRVVRHSFRMVIDLDGELPAPRWPDGFSVRTFEEGEERRVYEAQMDSFADTWSFARDPFEDWAQWFLGHPSFDPELWFLAEAEQGDLAGIALTRPLETETGVGWVDILGVRPAFRRRGLAIALLEHVFQEYARRGFERVGLGVDAENPTGAVRLYERAGMRVDRRGLQYESVQG